MNKSYEKVYSLLRLVPKGNVTTYGIIGKKLGMSPRVVGMILHRNPDSKINPCHRVVNRDGRVAPGFAFGGPGIQKNLLENEGVKFSDKDHVILENHLFEF